ncbi:MAG: ankyrin repeat domain-containing protein [Armatimonadetes bacterium]|nr:ankyrin repeat domain-containing protein [Armatimonadota bacterium]
MKSTKESIFRICRAGSPDEIRDLLSTSPELVNVIDELGFTPLHIVADSGKDQMVGILLEHGADVASKEVPQGSTPLHFASNGSVASMLLAAGADPNAQAANGESPLYRAALRNNWDVVELLRPLTQDIMIQDAVVLGDLDEVKHLCEENPNIIQSRFSLGRNLLHLAATSGRENVLDYLLSMGLDINSAVNSGQTSLVSALANDKPDMVAHLLSKGANPNLRDMKGQTVLHMAVVTGKPGIVTLLLSNGANPNIRDNTGSTPLAIADFIKNNEVRATLLQHGATGGIGCLCAIILILVLCLSYWL